MSTVKFDIAISVVLIAVVLTVLPESPFQYFFGEFGELNNLVNMHYVNWFIPFGMMVAVGQAWLACIVVYYAYMYIMRFVKLIS